MYVYSEENKKFYKTIAKTRKGEKNGNKIFLDSEVLELRKRYVNETTEQILLDCKKEITYSGLEKILMGRTYSRIPIYRKREKK